MKEIGEDTERAHKPGIDARIDDNLTVRGWDGKPDQRGGAIFANQATFHPTRYVNGVLKWLQNQSNFSCYTGTSVILLDEKGIEMLGLGQKYCEVKTESGNTVVGGNAVGTLWERCGNDKCAFAETQCHRSDGMESDIGTPLLSAFQRDLSRTVSFMIATTYISMFGCSGYRMR